MILPCGSYVPLEGDPRSHCTAFAIMGSTIELPASISHRAQT